MRVNETRENNTKWGTLKTLVASSSEDWVILVDAGTVWSESFLKDVWDAIQTEPRALGVAPSYKPLQNGWISMLLWRIERTLKSVESLSGGPVSLHGATVGYRKHLLEKALTGLGDNQWLNDDIVIPLMLRAMNPNGLILYPIGEVQDAGARNDQLDFGRRKRMLQGNLQWTLTLLPGCLRMNPVAGIVAGRRVFRILWAYWFAFLCIGLILIFRAALLPALVIASILVACSGSFRQLVGAAVISLMTPLHIARPNHLFEAAWK